MAKYYVTRIWTDRTNLYAETDRGEVAMYDLSKFKGFRKASPEQLRHFVVLGEKDIYWPQLDEDVNLEGLFYDNHICPLTPTEDSVVYRPAPEGNDCLAEPLDNS